MRLRRRRKQSSIQRHVVFCKCSGQETRKGYRLGATLGDGFANGAFVSVLDVRPEGDIAAAITADFPKRRNIGAHHWTSGEQRFHHRQTKSLDAGRRQQHLAIAITPLQFRGAYAAEQSYISLQALPAYARPDEACIGSRDTND